MADIGSTLLFFIKRKNYTQISFAKKMNISPSTLNKYIQNKRTIPLDLLSSFADELDCSLDVLAGRVSANYLSLNKDEIKLIKLLRKVEVEDYHITYQSIINLIGLIAKDENKER